MKWHMLRALSLATALSALPALPGAAQEAPLPAVTVTKAVTGDYTITSRLPGRVKASTVAEVRPQVSGIIRERLFEEGSRVEAGQPLYKIEDEIYAAAVAAARAAVAQAKANSDLAVLDAARAEELFRTNAGSAATRDRAVATRDAAEAAMQAARAQLASAEIDLERTTIRAPVSGMIGLSMTTTGALVGAQQASVLATIRELDPAYVDVTQSVTDLLRWNAAPGARDAVTAAGAVMLLPDGAVYAHKGRLLASEPQVEPTTGMVTLRVTFPNPDSLLLPGLDVEVEMPQAITENTVLVPQSAVMRDAHGGASVWLVEEGRIAIRPVTIIGSAGNSWITSEGLKDGDQIVTSGFQKAGPGAVVQILAGEGEPAASADADAGAAAPAGGN